MPERALRAKKIACANPAVIDTDEQMLPWVYDDESELWLSFNGNYSRISPAEKRNAALERETEELEIKKKAREWSIEDLRKFYVWSHIRKRVLQRDGNVCQLCKKTASTSLHIHHILKKREGGTEHFDNLITVCPSCHPKADRTLYNPDWETLPPKEVLKTLDFKEVYENI